MTMTTEDGWPPITKEIPPPPKPPAPPRGAGGEACTMTMTTEEVKAQEAAWGALTDRTLRDVEQARVAERRDQFAMAALPYALKEYSGECSSSAKLAYRIADAMLAAREAT